MVQFPTINHLHQYIKENGSFCFDSNPKELTMQNILLFSTATGDFNPAHCVEGFAEQYSMFKGVVSQGIGTLARAESEFLQLLRFEYPPEIVTSGLTDARYLAPLKVGDTYKYQYEITKLRKSGEYWKMECKIQCVVAEKVIASWIWFPVFNEIPNLPQYMIEVLQPKSYPKNVWNQVLLRPFKKGVLLDISIMVQACVVMTIFYFPVQWISDWMLTWQTANPESSKFWSELVIGM